MSVSKRLQAALVDVLLHVSLSQAYLDIRVAEEKLAVEVRQLDEVVVGDGDLPAGRGGDAQHRVVLQHFAAYRSCANL